MVKYFTEGATIVSPHIAHLTGSNNSNLKIVKVLDGGMGTCAKIQNDEGKIFAIKMIHSDGLTDKRFFNRYKEELKTWFTLSSCDGVCDTIGLSTYCDIPCIISEWMEGGNLRNFLPVRDLLLFYQTFDRLITSLQWVYDNHGIIHRDLKPENILVDKQYKCYIADWGLAKDLTKNDDSTSNTNGFSKGSLNLTEAGSFLGTITYASPEQIQGLTNIDFRSDIYSLGCIMYEWEVGRPPFIGYTKNEIAYHQVCTKPILESNHFKVRNIIEKCLQKDPNDRYQSYSELLNDFLSVANQHIRFNKYNVSERHNRHKIGEKDIDHELNNTSAGNVLSTGGKYVLVNRRKLEGFEAEAHALMELGEYRKALDILKHEFIPELIIKEPNFEYFQALTVQVAFALQKLGEYDNSILVLHYLDKARIKPLEYYVNLSCAHLMKQEFDRCERYSRDGLAIEPNDLDLLGNLSLALCQQGKYEEAEQVIQKSLSISRQLHTLRDAGSLYYNMAEEKKNLDFPSAIKYYSLSLKYRKEAVGMNPNDYWEVCNTALTLYKLKKYKECYDMIASLHERMGHSEIGIYLAASCLYWLDRNGSCITLCRSGLKQYPNSIMIARIMYTAIIENFRSKNTYSAEDELDYKNCGEFLMRLIQDKKNAKDQDILNYCKFMFLANSDQKDILNNLMVGLQDFPNSWRIEHSISCLLLDAKDYNGALKYATLSNQHAPWREGTYNILASVYGEMGDSTMKQFFQAKSEEIVKYKQELYKNA